MVDIKVSALAAATALDGTELLPVAQGGVSRKVTVGLVNAGTPSPMNKLSNVQAASVPDLSGLLNNQQSIGGGTRIWVKLWTGLPISITKLLWMTIGNGSGCSGLYTAFYDSTETLIPGSGSADLGATVGNANGGNPVASNVKSDGSALTIPAGFFYVGVSLAASTSSFSVLVSNGYFNNAFTGDGTTQYRSRYQGNAWSGATPPGTIGSASADSRGWAFGVR